MTSYRLSPNAKRSIENIEEYSLENFGKIQTGIYLSSLHKRMQFLAVKPHAGLQQTDIFYDGLCHSYFEGSHTIYYLIVSASQINIIDILHQSMEPKRHLLDKD